MNKHPFDIEANVKIDSQLELENCSSQFIQLIRDRLGIVIHPHQINDLYKTITNGCYQFKCTPSEFLKLLKVAPDKSPLLEHIVSGITVGETYFFRDKNQILQLNEYILPQLIKERREQNNLSLRIWSAGCSSGEEIYTIGIILTELLPDIEKWNLKLLATDINSVSLKKAISSVYSDWSMRTISDYYKKKYFTPKNKQYHLDSKISEMVNFEYLNLNDNDYPSIFNGTNAQDLILCRNVLIYFNNDCITRLMRKFNACLIAGGYLILGASDPIILAETDFKFEEKKGLIFRRPLVAVEELEPQRKKSYLTLSKPKKLIHKILPKFSTSAPNTKLPSNLPLSQHIERLTQEGNWQALLELIHQTEKVDKKSSFLLCTKATALANLGNLEEAITACETCFKHDPTNKQCYFTYALTLQALNRLPEAETAFRKTLFLDNKFVEGHFQLGLLLIKKKDISAGLRCLKNALKIVEKSDATQSIESNPGLNYGRFAEILRNEINVYNPLES